MLATPRYNGSKKSVLARLFKDGNLPQEVKVDGGESGLNQSPETPEKMRSLGKKETERERFTVCSQSKSTCHFQLSNMTHTSTYKTRGSMAAITNSSHRNTIVSVAHPPHCPLFLFRVNKAESVSRDNGESHQGCKLSLVIVTHVVARLVSVSVILLSYSEQVVYVCVICITCTTLTQQLTVWRIIRNKP